MNRSPLRHPVVVGGVVLGLLAVTVLNVRTFLPDGRLLRRGASSEAGYLIPPPDLADVVRDAVYGEGGRTRAAGGRAADEPGLLRDPFSGGTLQPDQVVTPTPTQTATPRPRRKPGPDPLVCTAVMLGGQQPLALIGGQAYRPGERVRGHEVLSIGTDGVRLRRPDGGELDLTVGPARADSTGFHVVTGSRIEAGTGDTRLAADPGERNER
ncbi:MAG: hypothetical protein R3D98_06790 [Candidatus Krumholzibacteriia bacterium]